MNCDKCLRNDWLVDKGWLLRDNKFERNRSDCMVVEDNRTMAKEGPNAYRMDCQLKLGHCLLVKSVKKIKVLTDLFWVRAEQRTN